MTTLERAAEDALAQGDLLTGSDPRQLAFEPEAALLSANWFSTSTPTRPISTRARRAVRSRLASEATPAGLRSLLPAREPGAKETGVSSKSR